MESSFKIVGPRCLGFSSCSRTGEFVDFGPKAFKLLRVSVEYNAKIVGTRSFSLALCGRTGELVDFILKALQLLDKLLTL